MIDLAKKHGLLITIVGPSGVGKDTLINELKVDPEVADHVHFVRRSITRDASKGGENFVSIDETTFEQARKNGEYCVTWRAHGLCYGVPADALAVVNTGGVVVLNGARRALTELRAIFRNMRVICITAEPDILAMRLMERGRENPTSIAERLKQHDMLIDPKFEVTVINNSGAVEDSVYALKATVMSFVEQLTKQEAAQ